ncbi:MAG: 2OG-Fe dioxygenase family protein [Lautropia sp.]
MKTDPEGRPDPVTGWSLRGDPRAQLAGQGFALLDPAGFAALTGIAADVLGDWQPYWNRLVPDGYLRDGGRYRARRHSCFVQSLEARPARDDAAVVTQVAHRAHWQSTDYNALHGGIDRWFEPIEPSLVADPRWPRLLATLGRLFAAVSPQPVVRWYIEAHPFRIDASDGVGRPTPEGAHRDGVDYVAVILIERHAVRGGETRVFDADGPLGVRFVIAEPWSALLLDDARVIHETTPIQPAADGAHRDTLVVTWRRDGFQAASVA